jgi:hypothetical protein
MTMTAAKPAVKERPILFSGPMIQAILQGRKTQTRRVVTPQPSPRVARLVRSLAYAGWLEQYDNGDPLGVLTGGRPVQWTSNGKAIKCPYGEAENRLWVREAWGAAGLDPLTQCWQIIYAAGGDADKSGDIADYFVATPGKRPSNRLRSPIHMPRWASRITLEITGIRAERLQGISTSDCESEGVQYPCHESNTEGKVIPLLRINGRYPPTDYLRAGVEYDHGSLMRAHFASGWDELNAKRGFSWESNPFCWVLEFKRLE